MTTIERNSTVRFAPPASTARAGTSGLSTMLLAVTAALGRLEDKLEKRRSRLSLEDLTDSQLKDIGISRADAYREACRPFWD